MTVVESQARSNSRRSPHSSNPTASGPAIARRCSSAAAESFKNVVDPSGRPSVAAPQRIGQLFEGGADSLAPLLTEGAEVGIALFESEPLSDREGVALVAK